MEDGLGSTRTPHNAINFIGNTALMSHDLFSKVNQCTWIVDSGGIDHVTYNRSFFYDLKELSHPIKIGLLYGSTQQVEFHGIVRLSFVEFQRSICLPLDII